MDPGGTPTSPVTTRTVVGQSPRTAAAFAPGPADETGAVLANLRTGAAARMNPSALAVWDHAGDGRSVADIIDDLAAVVVVDRPTLERDVIDAVGQLVALGFLDVGATGDGDGDGAGTSGDTGPTPCAEGDLTDPDPDGRRRVTVPASACQHNVDILGWHATTAIRVGSIDVGVRTNDAWATDAVRRTLRPWIVDDEAAPPNYSVVLAPPGAEPEPPHRRCGLFAGHRWISTDTDPDAVVDLLAAQLSAWSPTPAGHLRLELQAVQGDTGIVLTPPPPEPVATAVTSMARSRQWPMTHWPVTVDVAELSLAAPVISVGSSAPESTPASTIVAVVVVGDELARLDPAAALAALVPWLRAAPEDDADTVLGTAADLVARLTVLAAPAADLADVVAGLARRRQPM